MYQMCVCVRVGLCVLLCVYVELECVYQMCVRRGELVSVSAELSGVWSLCCHVCSDFLLSSVNQL